MFNPIPRAAVCSWTDKLDSLIQKIAAESRGTLTAPSIWQQIASGEWFLAEVKGETAVVLQEYVTPAGLKVLEIVGIAAESMKDWAAAAEEMEAIARARGVNRIRACGRLGWMKEAKRYGFKPTRVVVEKELYDA